MPFKEEKRARLMEEVKNHPERSAREHARILMVSVSTAYYYMKKTGFKCTEEEKQERIRKNWRKMLLAERRRILFGLPQKTKRKFVAEPTQRSEARRRLRKHLYQIEPGSREAYITEHTLRHEGMEKTAEKYGIKIINQIETKK